MKTAFGGRLTLLALTLGACLVAWPLAADGELRGTPEVRDGDTIVLQGRRLRLDGIDAPELGQSCRIKSRLYDCGMVARTALLDLTAGAEVVCRPLGPGPGGLTLARCFADDYDLSEGMTYTGWALALRRPQKPLRGTGRRRAPGQARLLARQLRRPLGVARRQASGRVRRARSRRPTGVSSWTSDSPSRY